MSLLLDLIVQLYTVRGEEKRQVWSVRQLSAVGSRNHGGRKTFLEDLKKVKLYYLLLRMIAFTDLSFEEGILFALCTTLHRNFVACF